MGEADSFQCPSCARQYRRRPEMVGKKVRCSCGHVILVSGSDQLIAEAPPPAPAARPAPVSRPAPMPRPAPVSRPAPIPAPDPRPAPAMPPPPVTAQTRMISCPSCGTPALPTAVLCQACSFNFRTGRHMPGARKPLIGPRQESGMFAAEVYQQAAKFSWWAPVIAFVGGCCIGGPVRHVPPLALLVGIVQLLLILGGLGSGVFALFGMRRNGAEGILVPAIVGICLNLGIIALNIILFFYVLAGKLPAR